MDHLEGIRAIAALWVVLSHIWIFEFGMYTHTGVMGYLTNWLPYSHLAVDVFIVLSGYCLTLPLIREDGLKGGVWGFYKRRARRILPPCYIALGLSIVIVLLLQKIDFGEWKLHLQSIGLNFLLLQDIKLPADRFDGPLWSIAVEWRIYLLFPLTAWIFRRYGAWVLLFAGLLGYALTAVILLRYPDALMACPWYLLLFAFGMCAASCSQRDQWTALRNLWLWGAGFSFMALAALLFAFPVTPVDGVAFGRHMPIIDAAAGLLTAFLLVGLSDRPLVQWHSGRAFLASRPLFAIGRVSYSLYLTHVPVLLVLTGLLLPRLGIEWFSPMVHFVVLVCVGGPLILAFAFFFHRRVERPFMSASPAAAHHGSQIPKDAASSPVTSMSA